MEFYSTSVVARGLTHSNMHRTQDRFRQLSKPTITSAMKQLASTYDTIRATFGEVFEGGACTQSVISSELLPYLALIKPAGKSQGSALFTLSFCDSPVTNTTVYTEQRTVLRSLRTFNQPLRPRMSYQQQQQSIECEDQADDANSETSSVIQSIGAVALDETLSRPIMFVSHITDDGDNPPPLTPLGATLRRCTRTTSVTANEEPCSAVNRRRMGFPILPTFCRLFVVHRHHHVSRADRCWADVGHVARRH